MWQYGDTTVVESAFIISERTAFGSEPLGP